MPIASLLRAEWDASVNLPLEVDDAVLVHTPSACRMRLLAVPYPLGQRHRRDWLPGVGRVTRLDGVRVDGSVVCFEEVVRLLVVLERQRVREV